MRDSPGVPLPQPQRDVVQADQHRHVDQRSDDRREGGAVAHAEGRLLMQQAYDGGRIPPRCPKARGRAPQVRHDIGVRVLGERLEQMVNVATRVPTSPWPQVQPPRAPRVLLTD